ncbi:DUF5706 domain-containing protein [Streptomyces sp. ACA25]|uniref:Pycsar system effector family protein n=1 Tax=Streptomyces sp. ACA25 TaxID=3022596 RepID=UPI002307E5A0|nr:Pycsar system effector family protein [Streptomyces sp. ACA25]MDB1088688.1 DUF5706 domain-containing protein [Streptomyces sp. ACA25]
MAEGRRVIIEQLSGTLREEMGRADIKASILLSGSVAVLLLGAGRLDGLRPSAAGGPALAALLVVGLLWVTGIALLIAAVLPRTRPSGRVRRAVLTPGDALFSAALAGATARQQLSRAVDRAGLDPAEWQLWEISSLGHILAVKYRCLRAAVSCLALSGAAAVALMVVHAGRG